MNNTSSIRSYNQTKSPAKQKNREWKLIHAKRAFRRASRMTGEAMAYTLCGDSVRFENSLLEYAQRKNIAANISAFNNRPAELVRALQRKFILSASVASRLQIIKATFQPSFVVEDAAFVDFDTCSWFSTVADKAVELCKTAYMVAVTVIIEGVRDFHSHAIAENMGAEDCCNPEKIADYLMEQSGAQCVGAFTYKNPYSVHKMVTVIMENTNKPTKFRYDECVMSRPLKDKRIKYPALTGGVKDDIRAAILRGANRHDIAKGYNISFRSACAIGAWSHPNLANKRITA